MKLFTTHLIPAAIFAVPHWLRRLWPGAIRVDPSAPKPLDELFTKIDTTPDKPVNFGYKMAWLAIRTVDSQAVIDALDIENVQPANWRTGFIAAYNGHAFISPPVNGWVFVFSYKLPEPGERSEHEWSSLLVRLSQKLGEVQYFGTHRVVEYHAWAQFVNGEEIRTYAYLGESDETLANRGEITSGERELAYPYLMRSPDEEESEDDFEYGNCPDEEHVMEVAGKWSINPNAFEQLNLAPGVGWIGNLVRKS
jgi:hypothetical protein